MHNGISDVKKFFFLCISEERGIAFTVLTSQWHFFKKLNAVAAGGPPCLRTVAAITMLTEEDFGIKTKSYNPQVGQLFRRQDYL